MKARIPPSRQVKREAYRVTLDYIEKGRDNVTRRFFKLFMCVMHEDFGFGVSRLNRLVKRVNELTAQGEKNPIFWKEIDHTVIDYMGIPFEREKTDIDGNLIDN